MLTRPRCGSPPSRGSTLMTSAPHSASTAPAAGTNVQAATSTILTPARTSFAVSLTSDWRLRADRNVDLEQLAHVAAHDPLDAGLVQFREVVDVRDRVGQTLGVRPVRAEHDAVGADQVRDLGEVVLP